VFNVCHNCGLYRRDKIIDPAGPYAVCPECGHKHPFRQLPLLLVSGASGTGKSSVCNAMAGNIDGAVLLDSDILWRREFDTPEDHYRDYFETWLRMAKNISQSGRPVVLFGAGAGVPENIEPCVERRYFSGTNYLALVCDDDVLAQRLRARPTWRGCGEPGYIENHIRFNHWFKDRQDGSHPITLIDTTYTSLEGTVEQVRAWILETAGIST
jgi:hypothetical protein